MIGFVPVNRYSHDLFIPLDGAWRILNGQRPHADFSTVLGPVYYLVEAAGIALAGGTAKGLAYASILMSTVLGAWAYLVSRSRLKSGAAIGYTLFVFVLAYAPIALGDPDPTWRTYALVYTRWGFGLMCILLVESAVAERTSFLGGISTGAVCALLLFLKVNFFPIAVVLLGISLLLRWDGLRARGVLTGFHLVAVPMVVYLRFDLAAMWRDLQMVAAGRGASVSMLKVLLLAESNWPTFVTTALLAGCIAAAERDERNGWIIFSYPIWGLVTFGASTLLLSTNYQPSGMPLGWAFALICVSRIMAWRIAGRLRSRVAISLIVFASAFIVYSMRTDEVSIVLAGVFKTARLRSDVTPFQSDALSGFITFGPANRPERPTDGQWLGQYVNDGMRLLRQNTSPADSVACLDYVNPFSFALKRPPNAGGTVWLAYGDSYSDRMKPDPERFLGSAAVVMIPKWPTGTRFLIDGALRNFGPYLNAHFRPVAESEFWILERPKY
jgi:hypothetical protein